MCTREEIEKLAYFIWEKEGQPKGHEKQHYLLAEQILLRQETTHLVKDMKDVKYMLKNSAKTESYHFQFSFAVAAMAVGATLSLINPPIEIAGIKSFVWGSVLLLISLALIVVSGINIKPEAFRIRRATIGTGIMLVGIIMIPFGSLATHYNSNLWTAILQLGGILVFIIGFYVAIFSKREPFTHHEH